MVRRIDQLLDKSLKSFGFWLVQSGWRGKEHDCVNVFATRFLIPMTGVGSAICEASQIRIAAGVPQPNGYAKPSARKNLVPDAWNHPCV